MAKKSFGNKLTSIIESAGAQMSASTDSTKGNDVVLEEGEKNISFRISKSLHRRLKMYAAQNEIKIKDLIIEMLEERITQAGY